MISSIGDKNEVAEEKQILQPGVNENVFAIYVVVFSRGVNGISHTKKSKKLYDIIFEPLHNLVFEIFKLVK